MFVALLLLTLVPAVMVVTLRNLVHAALMLGVSFVGVAGLYLLLNAEFVAVAQVLVYVGAVTVLILFAIMLTRGLSPGPVQAESSQLWAGAAAGGLVAMTLGFFLLNHVWPVPIDASPVQNGVFVLARQLLTTYIVPFEVASVLLLAALVAAIILARDEAIVSIPIKGNELYETDEEAGSPQTTSAGERR